MLKEKLQDFRLILASVSPRRQYLMKEAGFDFELRIGSEMEESYPASLAPKDIPAYLAELKASSFEGRLNPNEIVITADTMVLLEGKVMGKPVDYYAAFDMLSSLSGRKHEVITGVCLKSASRQLSFSVETAVWFRHLTEKEIHHYITECKPFDKAGAYGVQEWIGYIGVERIEGSYFNIVGLPIQRVYVELGKFIDEIDAAAGEKGKQ